MTGGGRESPTGLGTWYLPEISKVSKGVKGISWDQKTDSSLGSFFNSIDCLFPLYLIGVIIRVLAS